MKTLTVLVVTLVACGGTEAYWFSSDDPDNPSAQIPAVPGSLRETEHCLQLAAWGHCSFYDCLEARFPCGENGYTTKIGKHFCSKIDDNYNTFDAFGKRWLNRTSICLQTYLLPTYNRTTASCQAIKNAGIESIINCNNAEVDGRDFCDFLNTNGDAYNDLMGLEEVRLMMSLRNTRVVRSMITDAVGCGVESLAQKARSARAYIAGLFNRLTSYFWN